MPLQVKKLGIQVKNSSGTFVPADLLYSDSLNYLDEAKTAAVTAIQTKGAEILASIPEDYTKVTEDVVNLKSALINTTGDLLAFGNRENGTSRNVTFTWNADKTACTVNGENMNGEGVMAFIKIMGSTTVMPNGFAAGESYRVRVKSTNEQVILLFYMYENGTYKTNRQFYSDGFLTIPENINGLTINVALRGNQVANNDVISDMVIVKFDSDFLTVNTVSDIISQRHPIGTYIKTRGFNTPFDFGEALYQIKSSSETYTVDNVSVFKNANRDFIVRVYDKPYIYLESLNVENADWSVVDAAVKASGIDDVRAYKINMTHRIEIKDYNFTFDTITSSADVALLLYNMSTKKIIGRHIRATGRDNAIGLMCTVRDPDTPKLYFYHNYINILRIEATGTCVSILPDNGHGILENEYHFEYLRGQAYSGGTGPKYGLDIHIPAVKENGQYILKEDGTPLYSFEGEDHYWIGLISVKNNAHNGYGINIAIDISDQDFEITKIDPDTNEEIHVTNHDRGVSVFGTITGITFHEVDVEECDRGIRMRCGERTPTGSCQPECGIKSVIIHNIRVREAVGATDYFDIVGWFRDIYIRPTSKLHLATLQRNTSNDTVQVSGIEYDSENDKYNYGIINASGEFITIDAPIYDGKNFAGTNAYRTGNGIGKTLIATQNLMYIRDRIPLKLFVTTEPGSYQNTESTVVPQNVNGEYILRQFYENGYPCADYFYIADDMGGNVDSPKKITLDLREYYYNESAVGILVSVPAYCECYIRIHNTTLTKVCDANDTRKMYEFNRYAKRPSNSSGDIIIKSIY